MSIAGKRTNSIKNLWSKFSLLDKIFFWISVSAAALMVLVFVEYGSIPYIIATICMFVAPIIFIWALFKALKNRRLMGKMLLASLALFIIGGSLAGAYEPEAFTKENLARAAAEAERKKAVAEEETTKLKEQKEAAAKDFKAAAPSEDTEKKEVAAQNLKPESVQPTQTEPPVTQVGPTQGTSGPVTAAGLTGEVVTEKDTVTKVVDGDTIYTTKYKIRIIGLDTPETKDPRKPIQCFGAEASKRMQELVSGKTVLLETDASQDSIDKYGRALRNVYLENGINVAHSMIFDGYGHEYTYNVPYKWQAEYKAAEKSASDNNRGLWADDSCNGGATKSPDTSKAPIAPAPEPKTEEAIDTVTRIVAMKAAGKVIKASGYGPKNSTIAIKLNDSDRYEAKTDKNGAFNIDLPEGTSPIGSAELESVSGAWIFKSHKSISDQVHYSVLNKNDKVSEKPFVPVISKVSDSPSGDIIQGFYMPESKVVLKTGKTVLAKAETNDKGLFIFKSVKTKDNFAQVEIKSYTSGWLGTGYKEGRSLAKTYLNLKQNKAYAKLPITTKEESVTQEIAFNATTRNDASMQNGTEKITQEGKAGQRKISYRVTYEGDKKIKSEEVANVVVTQPVDQIKSIGTYVKPAPIQSPSISSPAPANSGGGVIKLSTNGICHSPGGTYYNRTTNYTAFPSLQACLSAGGRVPLR